MFGVAENPGEIKSHVNHGSCALQLPCLGCRLSEEKDAELESQVHPPLFWIFLQKNRPRVLLEEMIAEEHPKAPEGRIIKK